MTPLEQGLQPGCAFARQYALITFINHYSAITTCYNDLGTDYGHLGTGAREPART